MMHPYATDSTERKIIPFLLAVLSILCAWGLHAAFDIANIRVPWWVDAPSVLGFYGILYAAFNRWMWKVPILRKIGLVKVPDLSGEWTGYVTSSYDEHADKYEATAQVYQSWTQLSLMLRTNYSESKSIVGSITACDPGPPVFSYGYMNEPKAIATDTMHTHRGSARVRFDDETLEGRYYTGRDRGTYGVLHLERQEK